MKTHTAVARLPGVN